MWKFNPFTPKEPASLEGRTVDVGNIKVHIRNPIAEGGFSCVYLARDAVHASKQYAVKHIICNDDESLELVTKEISVMKQLREHPNVVTLVAHTILDMGRTKEAVLVMEFCDKSLVAVLENRGAGYFEEKNVLLVFRDVCNAVFAMHCQSPPIAHRDLKAENVLLGSDGSWKLCDFGSTSTNHKCFDRPEEMGIEEDNIRKHTTPAYRAPEMWDLYRREVISEKVDIWALGCLLYRICYLKSAFDGESKLQILNGNYIIPELPKYSAPITGLIKDMLEASPDARPDITQVWFRVNEQLPVELQKHLPDGPASAIDLRSRTAKLHEEGVSRRTTVMPQRSPPPVPSSREQAQNISPQLQSTSKTGGSGGPIGAFWSTQHAKDSLTEGPIADKESIKQKAASKPSQSILTSRASPRDFDTRFSPGDSKQGSQKTKASQPETISTFHNESFDTFVTEFDSIELKFGTSGWNANDTISGKEEPELEVNRLKEQLKQANLEKVEITAKYEKLSAICRSQREEIQELKRALAAATPSPLSKGSSKSQISPGSLQSTTPQRENSEGSVRELEQGIFASSCASPNPNSQAWQAFTEEPQAQPTTQSHHPGPIWAANGYQNTIKPVAVGPQISRTSVRGSSTSQRFGSSETKRVDTKQPSGWAGF